MKKNLFRAKEIIQSAVIEAEKHSNEIGIILPAKFILINYNSIRQIMVATYLYYKVRKDHGFCPYIVVMDQKIWGLSFLFKTLTDLGIDGRNICLNHVFFAKCYDKESISLFSFQKQKNGIWGWFRRRTLSSHVVELLIKTLRADGLLSYGDIIKGEKTPVDFSTKWDSYKDELGRSIKAPIVIGHKRWDELQTI